MKKHDCLKWHEEARGCSICSRIVRNFSKRDIQKCQEDINWVISELKSRNEKLEDLLVLAKSWAYEIEAPATVVEKRLFDTVKELKK